MNKKKTPQNHQGSRKILDDSLTVQKILSFADSLLEEWRPYLLTEGDMLLGRELSINRAIIHQLQNAVASRATTYDQLLKNLSELRAENEQLKSGYQDLCQTYDGLKKLIYEISVKQKSHISTVEKLVKKIGE